MKALSTWPNMLMTAVVLVCILAPISGISTEPSVNEQLLQAAKKCDLEQIKTLTAHGADVNAKDKEGRTALMWAVDRRNLLGLRFELIPNEAYKIDYWRSVNLDLRKYLVNQGEHVSAKHDLGYTAPIWVLQTAAVAIAKYLVDQGADVNAKDSEGYTVLMYAVRTQDLVIVKYLVDQGADMNVKDGCGLTALMGAVQSGNLAIVNFLVDHGADVNARGVSCENAKGRCTWCEYAVASGPRISTAYLEPQDHTALALGAESGYMEIMEFLIDKGADMNVKDGRGMTALIRAVVLERPDVMKFLIKKGADVNARDKKGKTALMYAVDRKPVNREVVKLLVDKGADLNAGDNDGMTALMEAAKRGNLDAVKLLIDRGADVNVKDKYGRTPLSYAFTKGKTAVAQYLKSHGAK